MIKVQIKGDKSSMETLQKKFKNIKKENDTYFLECPQFQKQKREDILTFAEEKLKQMVFILRGF